MSKRRNSSADETPENLEDHSVLITGEWSDEPSKHFEEDMVKEEPAEKEQEPVIEVATIPEPAARSISIRVWATLVPEKWDQLAGFRSYAKRLGLGPLTVNEWREAFNTFSNRPVN